jgi:hypothetical protein
LITLASRGLLEDIVLQRSICGVLIRFVHTSLSKALRHLEAEKMNLDIALERWNSSKARIYREDVERVADLLSLQGNAARLVIVLLVCTGNREKIEELRDKLSLYRCKPKIYCISKNNNFLYVRSSGYFVPLRGIISSLERAIEYVSIIERASENISIVIGVESRLHYPTYLPLYDYENSAYHTVVVGPTGTGKTTLLAHIAKTVVKLGLVNHVYILDPKGDLSARIIGTPNVHIVKSLDAVAIKTSPGRKLFLVDEAWRVEKDFLIALYKLARSKHVAVIAASQDPWDLHPSVWNNASNVVAFGSKSREYIQGLVKLAGVEYRDVNKVAAAIERGEYGIKYPWSGRLVLSRLPPALVAKL